MCLHKYISFPQYSREFFISYSSSFSPILLLPHVRNFHGIRTLICYSGFSAILELEFLKKRCWRNWDFCSEVRSCSWIKDVQSASRFHQCDSRFQEMHHCYCWDKSDCSWRIWLIIPSLQITRVKLDGTNYLTWSCSVCVINPE